ncbi:tetratricopeptide repeat protein [Desulfococcaceae bacterium HSG9]|nr:tetratricopeptide repeat protein [Desulfococcaceae bacterium HSG9]
MSTDNIKTYFSLSFRFEYLICLFLVVSTLAVYWQVKEFDFINYDDPLYTTENPYVQKGLCRESVIYAFTQGTEKANYWVPLVWLSHIIDYQLAGLNPGRFHLTNLLFHILNAVLLFLFFYKVTGQLWRSGAVAVLFALHPIHVESVAWVSERKDLVSAFFWFLTLIAYAYYVERPKVKRYLLVLLSFILGLMSKPMLVTLPFVLLILDYWPLGRFYFAPSVDNGIKAGRKNASKLVIEKIPMLALLPLVSYATWYFQRIGGSVASLKAYPFDLRIANMLVSYVSYIKKLLIPLNLAVPYPFPDTIPTWQWTLSVIILITISIVVLYYAKTLPWLLSGWLWYIGVLFPVSGVVIIGDYAMADRYAYLTFIGLYLIIVWSVSDVLSARPRNMILTAALFAIIAITLITTTWIQIGYWRNSITLFKHTVKITDKNYHAYRNLGSALAEKNMFADAIVYHRKASDMNPESVADLNNLANDYLGVNKPKIALSLFNKALAMEPNNEMTHYNLGLALSEQGRSEEALPHHYMVLRLKPDNINALINLGVDLAKLGKTDEAIAQYLKALKLNSGNVQAYVNLGNAMIVKKLPDKAIQFYHQALRLNPDNAKAYNNLGVGLLRNGKTDKAIACFRKALKLNPSYSEASKNLKAVLESIKIDKVND